MGKVIRLQDRKVEKEGEDLDFETVRKQNAERAERVRKQRVADNERVKRDYRLRRSK